MFQVPRFVAVESPDLTGEKRLELENLTYPVVFKPAVGYGGRDPRCVCETPRPWQKNWSTCVGVAGGGRPLWRSALVVTRLRLGMVSVITCRLSSSWMPVSRALWR